MSASGENTDVADRAVSAAMRLAADRGWRALSLEDVAVEAGIDGRALRVLYPCKTSILLGFARQVEAQASAQEPPFDEADSERDRLFELLMQRLDIMAPHRPAIRNILYDLPREPLAGAAAFPTVLRIIGDTLEAANISSAGPLGLLRAKGLVLIWLATLAVWVEDDSPDAARTMAALDRNLRRIEPLARLLGGARARPMAGAAPGGF